MLLRDEDETNIKDTQLVFRNTGKRAYIIHKVGEKTNYVAKQDDEDETDIKDEFKKRN